MVTSTTPCSICCRHTGAELVGAEITSGVVADLTSGVYAELVCGDDATLT